MANEELPEGAHKTLALHAPNALQVDRIWRTYWLPLFTSDGATKLNLETLKGELYDSWWLVNEARKVYGHITGGVSTDLTASAEGIIALSDRQIERTVHRLEERVRELEAELESANAGR